MTRPQTQDHKFGQSVMGHWLLAICLVCAVAITPLLRGESPCTHDGGLHYFRVAAMRHAFKQGLIFTRWLPDLAFGYGFPFFNYRAPLSYYLALGLHLTGLPLPWSLNLVYALSILASAVGAYLLARDLFGPTSGLVAAVAYAYAPYQLLDALVRGNAPESVALALMPFVLWAFRRLALQGGRRWFLASCGLLTALYLTHNISSLLFTPLLAVYLVTLWLVYRKEGHWASAAGALALALGLIAFLWLPALAEKKYVQLNLTRANRNNDFHYNFVGLAEIFAPPTPVDTSLMNPPMEIHLGVVQAALAGLGLIVGLVRTGRGSRGAGAQGSRGDKETGRQEDRERRGSLVFFAASAAAMILMSTRASVWLWEHVPLLPFVQFPWRFVGRATLPVALLAGAFVHYAIHNTQYISRFTFHVLRFAFHVSRFTFYVALIALILAAFPATYPPSAYCPMKPYPSIQDVHRYERQSGLVGVDPVGAYFPSSVQDRPEGSPLEAQYASGGPIARFDETALPEGAEVLEANYGSNRARLVVESPEAFRARYLTFHFPGWRVRVDGERVQVTPSDPEGLITFDVPPGRHQIRVRFGETPLRLGADAISLLSLVIGMVAYWHIGRSVRAASAHQSTSLPANWFTVPLAILLLALKLAIVDHVETPFRHPRLRADGTLPGLEHPLNQPYPDGLRLIGYKQREREIPADGTLRVDLYWTVRHAPSRQYQTVVHLVGLDGNRWSPRDSFRPRGYHDAPPAYAWSPGRYALDSHEVEPLPGTPPGTYDVVLTVFDRETLAPLSVLNEHGQPAAPELSLGQMTLTSPRHPADPDRLGIRHRLDARLGPLTLLGADFDRDEAAPGDPVLVTAFWRAEQQPAQNLTLQLQLLNPDGSPAAAYDFPPAAAWHPTLRWKPGDVWRGQHLLHLPADLDTAAYAWTVSLSPSPSLPISLSQLSVTAPDRTFAAPPVDLEIDVRLGDVATLVGANVKPETLDLKPGTAVTVTLVWRAEAETHISHRVFLHLIGPDPSTGSGQGGALIAQSDGIPADWSRPTTGWLPEEFITDTHSLTLPADAPEGEYTLRAGLYIPGGERLTTPDGSDAVPVSTIRLEAP